MNRVSRVNSYSLLHEYIYRNKDFKEVDIVTYFRQTEANY